MALAGRGWGKTRVGAEWVRDNVCGDTPLAAGNYRRVALIAETAADARDVLVEGESGLLACHPKDFAPNYESSKRRVTWPNGAIATLYNAVEPDQLRGPQHDAGWCDELAKWRYARETWDMFRFGLRLGNKPRTVVTTTPKPIKILREILAMSRTHVTRGTTYDNRENLAPDFFEDVIARYEGTRLGRQELRAEVLEEAEGALWSRDLIEVTRVANPMDAPEMRRVVVAIDPAVTSTEESDETGLIVAGRGIDDRGYVIEDISGRLTPDAWARRALDAMALHRADRVLGEVNNGGDLIEHTLRTINPNVPYKKLHASRGKQARAEPISALYEQKRISHIGSFPELEDEQCTWEPNSGARSPSRLDALVWAFTELFPMAGERRSTKIKGF